MIELVRTNDAVIISFVESLMRDAGIACFVADQNMSILEGSIGLLQKRVMVDADQADAARRIRPDKENLFATVEYDRTAWERVQQGVDRWARR